MGSINWKVYFILTSLYIIIVISSATAIAIDYPDERPSIESGKKIYLSNCAGCHGMLGDGYGFPEALDFTNLSQTASKQPSVFFDRLTQGIPGTAMLSYKSDLTENERWDAVKYLFTFKFSDYQFTVPQLTVPQTTLPQITPAPTKPQYSGKEWYNTIGGGAIILVSAALAIFILYLFIRGLKE